MNCYQADFLITTEGKPGKGSCYVGAQTIRQAFEIAQAAIESLIVEQISNDPDSGVVLAGQPIMGYDLISLSKVGGLWTDDKTMLGKVQELQMKLDKIGANF